MNDIFEFIKKTYFLQKNSQFRPEDPNGKIWDGNIENMTQNLSPNECKATIKLAEFRTKVKAFLEDYAKYNS